MRLFAIILMAVSLNFLSCDDDKVSSDSTGIKVNFGECKVSTDSYKAEAVEGSAEGRCRGACDLHWNRYLWAWSRGRQN